MIKRLIIKDGPLGSFDITFTDGVNIIKGKNGIGKTHILDCIALALFGVTGPDRGFSTIQVTLEFEVQGETYISEYKKGKTNSFIVKGVSGVKPYDLLGFDDEMFKYVHYCPQDRLLDVTHKSVRDTNRCLDKVFGYGRLSTISEAMKTRLELVDVKLSRVLATLEGVNLEEEADVDSTKLLEEKQAIENKIEFYNTIYSSYDFHVNLLNNLDDAIDQEEVSLDELQAAKDQVKKHQHTLASIELLENQLKPLPKVPELSVIEQQEKLHEDLVFHSKLHKAEITCPSCGDKIAPPERPPMPRYSRAQLNEFRFVLRAQKEQESARQKLEELRATVESVDVINDLNVLLYRHEKRMKALEDRDKVQSTLREIESNVPKPIIGATFEKTLKNLKDLKEVQIHSLNKQRDEINKQLRSVGHRLKTMDRRELIALRNELQAKKEDYQAIIEGVEKTKNTISATSLPVFNATASKYMTELTGSERSVLKLDGSTYTLDGGSIRRAEGSSQTLANIALRLSFLNTFYKTFPVFIGDEIDASLHKDRVRYLDEFLQSLDIQVILTTHKDSIKGNVIDLEQRRTHA